MRRYADGETVLFGPDGTPLWTFRSHRQYARNLIGFMSPEAREQWDESLRGDGDERPPVVAEATEQAAKEGRSGEGQAASQGG